MSAYTDKAPISVDALELVESFAKGRANRRVLIGEPRVKRPWVDCRDGIKRRLVTFSGGQRFALNLWERNDYGTTRWRVVIAEAPMPGEVCSVLPAMRPGARILADVQGSARVRAFMAWLRSNAGRIGQMKPAELARVELHFQRAPIARLRAAI